ncbi:MAG: GntR family transcriptional regulator [Phycisphaerae bacterium]|nr:GntR family transcriptional regulator [Phycisphaerae bacterium]
MVREKHKQTANENAEEFLKPPGVSTRNWLRDSIYHQILRGELPMGSRIGQQQLAKQYHVGQGMIREAILQLQQFGVVEMVENRGFFVTRLDTQKLLDAYELREVLEGLAARLCCRRATPEQLDQWMAMTDRIYELGRGGQYWEMGYLDRELHNQITAAAGNIVLSDMVSRYRFLVRKIVWGKGPVERTAQSMRETHDEHIGVLTAIRQNLSELAEQRMRSHIRKVRVLHEERIRKGNFQLEWIFEAELRNPVFGDGKPSKEMET